ncbi:Glycosyltransferase family 69 protein [Mycena chlorophos]|uniref:Glycosyltransferase family 69 protein n=1 Tax=Mycena chlorophos TaxID=658473 RepID=A0A8H6S5J6_MYCCL|nr:Glycosyltransferase family 69 protein [Mycena chlorophos]
MAALLTLRRRSLSRVVFIAVCAFVVRWLFFSSSSTSSSSNAKAHEIQEHNFIERARQDKSLNVQKHRFLQARMGRDEREELMGDIIRNGADDYWERFQLPYIMNKDTSSMDTQHVVGAIDQLLSLNGWVAALCPTLTRPFGQHKHDNAYDDLVREDHLYYIAIVIHSADHFLVDQLAVIVQMAKRLGTNNLFVSMLDYDSSDSTETLTDLCEAVLTLLGVPFRIRRVPGMTEDPAAAYYPLEEAHMRNLALEPLHELYHKRGIRFQRVIWLKGFTCPNDILETIKISFANEAAMVCGMDWAEHNGFFIFSDRWRTRDIDGDQFRQSKSSSKAEAVPPRDQQGANRYAQHLPFQVFCCESGTHVVDPEQSYYKNIAYRAGTDFHNLSRAEVVPTRDPDAPCLDSSQAWFCRDLWVRSAHDAMDEVDQVNEHQRHNPLVRRQQADVDVAARDAIAPAQAQAAAGAEGGLRRQPNAGKDDADANAGSDYDAMPEEEGEPEEEPYTDPVHLSIPNSNFRPARILVNPRCPTTYAGVSHTQLALDLFGTGEDSLQAGVGKYVLEDWEGAPESFVCQEQRQTGGRKATKTQRRLGFSIHDELQRPPFLVSVPSTRQVPQSLLLTLPRQSFPSRSAPFPLVAQPISPPSETGTANENAPCCDLRTPSPTTNSGLPRIPPRRMLGLPRYKIQAPVNDLAMTNKRTRRLKPRQAHTPALRQLHGPGVNPIPPPTFNSMTASTCPVDAQRVPDNDEHNVKLVVVTSPIPSVPDPT